MPDQQTASTTSAETDPGTPRPSGDRVFRIPISIWVLAALIAGAWLVTRLDFVVTPLVLAWFIAYVLDPAADKLQSWRVPRTAGVLLLLLAFLLLALLVLLWIVPLLAEQLRAGLTALPGYLERWREWVEPHLGSLLTGNLPVSGTQIAAETSQVLQQGLTELARRLPGVIQGLFTNVWALVGAVLSLTIIPVFAFYLLLIFDELDDPFVRLFPVRFQDTVQRLLAKSDEVLSAFIRGQLTVCLILAVLYSVGLTFTGIDMPWVVGSVSGILFFIPYLGTLIGVVAASILALLKFHDFAHLFAVWGVFAAVQSLEGFVLTPRIVGDRVGLNPVGVLVAVLVGGRLFGAAGVLLAVPAAAVIRVGLEEALDYYRRTEFYRA